jgi:hypothetical protein
MHTNQPYPPATLVRTWISLLNDDNEVVSRRASQMLLGTFGDMNTVFEYVNANKG